MRTSTVSSLHARPVDCIATDNLNDGFRGSQMTVRNCFAQNNQEDGIQCTSGQQNNYLSVVEDCTVTGSSVGIRAEGRVRLVDNTITTSTTAILIDGFSRCVVDGNGVTTCSVGVQVLDANDNTLIVRNTFAAVPMPIDIGAGHAYGPFVLIEDVGDISGVPMADHPLANLVH